MSLSVDDIMRRFDALCPQPPSIKFRPTFKADDSRRWYVCLPRVQWIGSDGSSSSLVHGFDGPTPEAAVRNAWATTVDYAVKRPNGFFGLFTCPDNVPIPGDTPQAWVRLSLGRLEWQNVVPTPLLLERHRIPADRIFPYNAWEIRGDR